MASPFGPREQAAEIAALDERVAAFGGVIWKPLPVVRLVTFVIRPRERGGAPSIIDLLK